MKPSHVSNELRRIASKIEKSENPRRDLVLRDIRNILAAVEYVVEKDPLNTPVDVLARAAQAVGLSYEEAENAIADLREPGEPDPILYEDVLEKLNAYLEGPI
jgi:hypothetical protein